MTSLWITSLGEGVERAVVGVALVFACVGWLGTAGCVEQTAEPVFYPPAPGSPYIQYLTTLSGEKDMQPQKSSFAKFLVGDEPMSQRLEQPYGIAMHAGKMYVADTGAGGLAIFDMEKKAFSLMQGAGNGRMKRPINVRIDTDGTKYVTDTQRDQILVFDKNDRFVTAFGNSALFRPVDVAVGPDRLYVTDLRNHQVHILDKKTGNPLAKFGKAGSSEGELFHPTSISLSPEGDLYVADTSNYRVQRFTVDGKHVQTIGEVGSAPGSFARPKGVAVDRSGRIYVGDAAFENVQIFDKSGKLLLYFGQPGEGQEGLNLPAAVSLDYDNVGVFRQYAQTGFEVEYLIMVSSQFGPNKVDVFGFGRMKGVVYEQEVIKSARLDNK